jgi:hypothetical protein
LSISSAGRVYSKSWIKEKQKIVLNKISNNDNLYVSKPPKFDGKRGSAYVIWDIKFRSWAGVKGFRGTLVPSFDSKLPATEEAVLDNTDHTQKAQGIAIKQNAIAMDAIVQCISKTDNFHCIHQSMQEDADWPYGRHGRTSRITIIPPTAPLQQTVQ